MLIKEERSSIFRGATKPVMAFGVPMMALGYLLIPMSMVVLTALHVAGFKGAFLSLLPLCAIIPIMRELTKRDDQYLKIMFLDWREKLKLRKNKISQLVILPPRPLRDEKFMKW